MLKSVTKIGVFLSMLTLLSFFSPTKISAQNFITVPFTNGFVGQNTANNEASNAYYLFGLGWKNIQFAQNSSANIFVAQGNDIIGMVLITDNNNVQHTINGFIKWRAPNGNVTTICFQPAPGTNFTLATNGSNGSSTYALDSNKYIGLTFNGQTLSITPIPGTVNGNAATAGLLDLLNNYLNSFPRILVFGANTNASDSIVVENAGTKNINIKLSVPSTNTIKVRYRTIPGTALAGQDYTTVQDTLTFLPNDTIETITVPIINNLVVEPNEYFDIQLFEPVNAVLFNSTKRITILDDDVANTAPNANDDNVITKEDSVTIINVLANDVDTTGLLNAPTIKTQPTHGTVTVNTNGTITYTPTANYFGVDSFMYKVCDNGTPSLCDSAWVRLTVNSVNDVPNANDDNGILNEDTPLNINVRSNDTDIDGTLNNPTINQQSANGTVVVNANGTVTYTPNANYFGVDSFMYKVCDNGTPILCDSAWVRLTINSVNDAPDAVNDTVNLAEDGSAIINVRNNDTDVDGTLSNPTVITNPLHGTVTVNTNGTITYVPLPNYHGVDSFQYRVCDNSTPALCDSAWVKLNISSVNDAPIVRGDTLNTNGSGPFIINVLNNDSDDGGFNTPSVCRAPQNGTAVVNSNGTITYTPNASFTNGVDSFLYCVCDNGMPVVCDSAWVRINLSSTNTAPIANDDNYIINEDVITDFNVRSNDSDQGGALNNPTALINPKHGTITINLNGTIKYTPSLNYFGPDSFMYKVCDNGTPSLCDSAWVRITINSVNDRPDLNDDTLNVNEDGSGTIDVRLNDNDVDGNLNPPTLPIQPSKGTVVVNPNGTITYTPNPDAFGPDSFMYKICDSGTPVLCDSAWVRVNITPVNDKPRLNADTLTLNEDDSITVDLRLNDTDDGVLNPPTLPILPSKGTVVVNPNGTISYIPNPDVFGPDSFMYKICDNGTPVLCDSAWVRVNITPVNDVPNANDDNTTTVGGQPVVIDVRLNDNDKEGALNPPVIVINPAHGTATITPDGKINYVPNPNYYGPDSFMYKVCDNGMPILCDSAWVRVNNTRSSDPIANDDVVNATEDQLIVIDVKLNDVINDGSNNPPVVVVNPPHGTVTVTPDGKINYVPNPDYNGVDSFMYKICNNANPVKCDSAWVRINVDAVNDAPDAKDDVATVNKNSSIDIDVRANDDDKEGKSTINNPVVIINPKNGTFVINPNGTVKYTPALNYIGNDSFMYRICDNGTPVLCDSAWVRINVVNPASNPIAVNDTLNVNENGQGKINVAKNDINPNGGGFALPQIITNPANGTLLPISLIDSTFMYVPNTGYIGADKFTYVIADANNAALRDTAEVVISVNELEVKVPGGFSPDKDGVNDAFIIPGIEKYPNNKLTIVNRWGEVVYFKQQYNNEWTGEPNKGFVMDDGIVPAGTYFYILETGTGGKPISGSIYINR